MAPPTGSPFWLDSPNGPLAARWHGDPGVGGGRSVVICNPVGTEHASTFWTLRELARRLAVEGVPTLRFDYSGLGNSAGEPSSHSALEHWITDIATAIGHARERTGVHPVVVGVRLGATLAAMAAVREPVSGLVLWGPVRKGRTLVREWQALARLNGWADGGPADMGAFSRFEENRAALEALELARAEPVGRPPVLWVQRDDLPEPRIQDGLLARPETQRLMGTGFGEMIQEPHFTVLPEKTLGSIVAWTMDRGFLASDPPAGAGMAGSTDPARPVRSARAGIVESFVEIPGDPPLFAVHTEPVDAAGGPGVLFLNSGSVHQIGPHRLYVELARALARAGISSLRVDLRNLGESLPDPAQPRANHPYPETAVDDALRAGRYITGSMGREGFVMAGLCSGAHTAYRAALDADESLRGVLLLNPLTFRWREGMSLDIPKLQQRAMDALHYQRSILDKGKWWRLVRGKVNVFRIASLFAHRGLDEIRSGARRMAERLRLLPRTSLAEGLDTIAARGTRLGFFFSENDPGPLIVEDEAAVTMRRLLRTNRVRIWSFAGADHTFSHRKARTDLAIALVDYFHHEESR